MSETMTVYAEKPPPPPAPAGQNTTNVASPPSHHFQHHFQSAHNTHYTGRHRSGVGTNRYEMQQRRRAAREARERAEAEEARHRVEAEEAQHRHNEETRLRQEQEARQRHEEDIRRREHEEWAAKHPLQAAEKWLNDANDNIRHKENERNHAEQQLRESENNLEHHRHRFIHSMNEYNHRLANTPKRRRLSRISREWSQLNHERHRVLEEIQCEINRLQDEVNHRRSHLDHCHHQLHEAHQNKSRAEHHLSNMRENIRREQQAEAERKAQAAAKLKEQEEAKSRAEEAARRKEQEENEKKAGETERLSASLNAVRNDTGIPDEPLSVILGNLAITPQSQTAPPRSKPVNDPMKQDVIADSAAIPAIAALGVGTTNVVPLAGNTATQVKNAIAALSRIATLTPAGAMATTVLAGLYPTETGKDSDNLPGGKLFVKTLPSTLFDMPSQEDLLSAAETCRTIEVPLRGRLGIAEGEVRYELVKTVRPTPVTVIAGIPDGKGRYHFTLPATDDLPARTILINPANAPGVTGPTATPSPAHGPQAITHTGGQTKPSGLPIITRYPDPGDITFNDIIVVPPLESGGKPVYVMFSDKLGFTDPKENNSRSEDKAEETVKRAAKDLEVQVRNKPGNGNQLRLETPAAMLVNNPLLVKKLPDAPALQTIPKPVIDAKKFDYLFGRASGNAHTLNRTNQLSLEMKRLGVTNDGDGHAILEEYLKKTTKDQNNIVKKYTDQHGSFEVRESFFIGPSGKATILESTFEVMKDGSHRFITTIPKNGASQ